MSFESIITYGIFLMSEQASKFWWNSAISRDAVIKDVEKIIMIVWITLIAICRGGV
jgi:hypothetical protein